VRGFVRLIQGIYHHDDIFHMAPAMAFHFFLSLLPLLVFVGYVVGKVAEMAGVSAVFNALLDSVSLPGSTREIISSEVGRLATVGSLGPLGALGFLWIASGGMQGLLQAVERVIGAPPRPWWRQRLLALGWVVGMMVAFGIAAVGSIQWDNVRRVIQTDDATTPAPAASEPPGAGSSTPPLLPSSSDRGAAPRARRRVTAILRAGGGRVLAIALTLALAVGGLAGFYQFSVKLSRRVRRRVVPGALLAVALVIVISWGFSLYVRTLARYTLYYGSLAAIAVLLIWLWLASVAILVGAELNSQLEGLRD
jgi:membrane protein